MDIGHIDKIFLNGFRLMTLWVKFGIQVHRVPTYSSVKKV